MYTCSPIYVCLLIVNRLEDLEDEEEEDSLDDYTDEDVIDSVCNALVNTVLSSVQGQHALVVSSLTDGYFYHYCNRRNRKQRNRNWYYCSYNCYDTVFWIIFNG